MTKALIIVESPAKARTISRYLGSGFIVESSIGHIRDLPSMASEIPAKYKGESWARLGVNVEEDFKPLYIIPAGKAAQVKKLKSILKEAAELYLATDVDREGEAIAWHLTEVLKPKCPVKRMTFEEITKAAIVTALEETRGIDQKLVNAQETRRILDRLYGYEVSPLLWRKVKPKLSAGRVQSVATRMVVERERLRMRFVQAEYWDIDAVLQVRRERKDTFEARLVELGGKRIAQGKDFDDGTGKLKEKGKVMLLGAEAARSAAEALAASDFTVVEVTEKPFKRQPYAPFITSTLQQEAARKLRYSAQRTMRLAQNLYENGYITYMRTDSTQLSNQAVRAARAQVAELYGEAFLPEKPRIYARKAKGAQEAHEAIRPAGDTFHTPRRLAGQIEPAALRLYELIWKRTVASQMKDATGMRTNAVIRADAGPHGTAVFTASGKVVSFPGFLRAYVEGSDDPKAELADQEKMLPALKQDQKLDPVRVEPSQHLTQPPPRYTEASLIKELEERGIGRPSTYANIIQTIQDRGYVWGKGTALIPTFTAFAVVNLLEQHLRVLVDYDFTAKMEDGLDAIASGKREPVPWLREFYFGETNGDELHGNVTGKGLKALIDSSSEEIDAREVSSIRIGVTEEGEQVTVRVGRYGPYVQDGESERRATVSDDVPPDEFDIDKALALIEQAGKGDRVVGMDPETSKPVYAKTGRFGPYVQLGDPEVTEKGKVKRGGKPKMASLWPSMSLDTITLEEALMLLSFPRELGVHPETGQTITVQDGRFGPYVKMGDDSRSLPGHEKLRAITLEEAVEIYKQPKGKGRRKASTVVAELGKRPGSDTFILVKTGRYGPYVTDGVVNATLPKGKKPEQVSLEEALDLIASKEQKLRDQGKDPGAAKGKGRGKRKAKKKSAGRTGKTGEKTAKKKKSS